MEEHVRCLLLHFHILHQVTACLFTSSGTLCMFFKHHQLPFTKQLAHNCAYFQIKAQALVPVPVRFDWTRSHRRTLRNGDRDVKAFPTTATAPLVSTGGKWKHKPNCIQMIAIGAHVLWERFEVSTCADIAIWRWRGKKFQHSVSLQHRWLGLLCWPSCSLKWIRWIWLSQTVSVCLCLIILCFATMMILFCPWAK